MKFRPLNNTVIIALDEGPEKTESGLYFPPNHRLPQATGTVVAIGRGILMASGQITPPQTKVGDRVVAILDIDQVKKIDFDGKPCVCLPDENMILGILEA